MTTANPYLDEILHAQKAGQALGIGSVCSAHPDVLQAVLQQARENNRPLLIEATCNQVNQYGGYTGMTPKDFVDWLRQLADRCGLPREQLMIGGDHLGPNVWRKEPSEQAMHKSHVLVADYVRAGFQKIHLDTSMHLGDDPQDQALPPALIAARTAELAKTAENTFAQMGLSENYLRYVIGTEVPPPGGMQSADESIHITSPEHVQETLKLTRDAFNQAGLKDAWQRVMAVVVHPGVEFGNEVIYEYDHSKTTDLKRFIEGQPGIIYEAHSTDYQTRPALRRLVADHFALLKVGPALTFAYREAIFALAYIEHELLLTHQKAEASQILAVLESVMQEDAQHWQGYYRGDAARQAFQRRYSLSDRIRYYWAQEPVQSALRQLLTNLSAQPVPLALLSQYLPRQYWHVREGQTANTPSALIQDAILAVWEDYEAACQPANHAD